ncbi:UDP-N-acetylmuramoyl-tripeptide--D-alanyl-D-alanine ligase [Thermoactinomyces sp. DSM 45891]|uniref:UDP-N-acetylmuramoyl-tripeptide--D-alanyl-D- alanine ligase n=1 Tax=Thermoactinomyces sp. DSM 45891 TaxID=1761907 RepID=UPI000919F1F6|nr:UDP-N-acetylmuramoyl-tripeptide--D-alanyl-D-alanine ligase [Thermoactinomyces sp. DSM 45891]SFX51611.1 UDP-N-acetylmuramoyl-tripeptide--D-alanyl-D-alanine ligase [Thermoactinomyces sp. DSM 45891]
MIKRTIHQIVEMLDGAFCPILDQHIEIQGVSIDSRTVQSKNLFIPIKGEHFNGHEFVQKAIQMGAAATLWMEGEPSAPTEIPVIYVKDTLVAIQTLAREYRKQLQTKVIGITGSNGKTSTKDILASLLETQYKTQKTFGNLNNHLGVPLTILQLEPETEMAVIEMGMSGLGEIELLSSIALPDVAIITNIGEAHLDQLKSRERIAQAKLEILSGLEPNGIFIYDGDEPLLQEAVHRENLGDRAVTVGLKSSNSYRPFFISIEREGISFSLPVQRPIFYLPMLGKYQVLNALSAIAVCHHYGISNEQIRNGFLQAKITGGRNELIKTPKYTILNDSYKSNPSSLCVSLETLSTLSYKKKIVVLGDMNGLGSDEVSLHEKVGAELDPKHIDYVFTVGKLAEHIAKVAKGHFPEGRVASYQSAEQEALIDQLRGIAETESIILIKGSRENKLDTLVEELKDSSAPMREAVEVL